MAITVSNITFKPELTTGTTGSLLGNIMNKIVAEISISVAWQTAASVTNPFTFTAGSPDITRQNGSFITDGFNAGDTIIVPGSNAGTYTILSVTALTITCTGNMSVSETIDSGTIYGITPVTDIDHYYNLIENSDSINFTSLIDGNTQKLHATGLDCTDATPVIMTFQGIPQSWAQGSATIEGTSASDWASTTYEQEFKITHEFYIAPFFYNGEISQLIAGMPAPTYFDGAKCLKYVCRDDAFYSFTDVSKYQTGQWDVIGNTGWFNERFNGNTPAYSVDSIAYTDTTTSDVVPSIQYCGDTHVVIVLNSANSKFSDGNTEFVLNVNYNPLVLTDYQNTTTDMQYNFMFDRAKQTVGAASVDGDNYGTTLQIIQDLTATFLSADQIQIEFDVNLDAALVTRITALGSGNRYYTISVETADYNCTTATSDDTTVLCDVEEFYCNPETQAFYVSDYWEFCDHRYNSSNINDYKGWVQDGILAKGVFYIDTTNSPTFDSLELRIEAEKTGFSNIVLESYIFNPALVDIQTTRGFQLYSGDPKNEVELIRRSDLDTANKEYYECNYGFKARWEDWLTHYGVPTGSGIPVAAQTERWSMYSNSLYGWETKFNIYAKTTIGTNQTTHKHTCNLVFYTFNNDGNSNAYYTGVIETFDSVGGANLNGAILGFRDTVVKATITRSLIAPAWGFNHYGILEIEKYQQGGIYQVRQISSIYPPETDTWWSSALATVTEVDATTMTIEANIDYTKLDLTNSDYKLYARLGNGLPL